MQLTVRISYCGLEVQKHTQALKSVKDQGNIFYLNHKWARTLPSLIYFDGIFIETPLNNFWQSSCPLGVSIKGIVLAFN
jgi:hypothetical protein